MSASTERKNRQAAREAGTDKKMLASQAENEKQKKSRLRWTVGTIAVIVFIATVLFVKVGVLSGNAGALTIDGAKYSVADVNYYYGTQYQYTLQQLGDYAAMFGLDTSNGIAALADQPCSLDPNGGSWRDYLLDGAIEQMKQQKALCDYAKANGIELTQEELANIDAEIDSMAAIAPTYGYSNVDNLLTAQYGKGVNAKVVAKALKESALASKAVNAYIETLQYTDEELEEYYASLNGASDVFEFSQYYIPAESGEDGTVSDEAKNAAKATAEAILAAYKTAEGDSTAEKLDAAVASEVADAVASHRTGVSGSSVSSYVFNEWMMASRTDGDAEIFEDNGSWYVVAFIARDDNHYKVANVRHILIQAEADENGEYTDEAKAAAKATAEDIYKTWQAGEKTEESFAELANEFSQDPGSNTNGGLYENVVKGQMVPEFDKFCFEGHKSGDTALVYGETSGYCGWHVMYYVGEGELYSNAIAENALINTACNEWLTGLTENCSVNRSFGINLAAK